MPSFTSFHVQVRGREINFSRAEFPPRHELEHEKNRIDVRRRTFQVFIELLVLRPVVSYQPGLNFFSLLRLPSLLSFRNLWNLRRLIRCVWVSQLLHIGFSAYFCRKCVAKSFIIVSIASLVVCASPKLPQLICLRHTMICSRHQRTVYHLLCSSRPPPRLQPRQQLIMHS